MRKTLLLILVGSMGFTSAQASSSCGQDGKTTATQVGNNGGTSIGRPRAHRKVPTFQIVYEPTWRSLVVYSFSDGGLVHAVIENLSTGAHYFYTFDSSEPAILPISGEAGVWMVMLYSMSRNVIEYEFEVD